ncbi:MAG: hypothetical protein ACHQWU_04120 [Gemmatimonadales bacterium]
MIDTATRRVRGTIAVGERPYSLVIVPAEH